MIVFELLAATLFSSVVGSMHCVGMCSPFAMLAMGPTNRQSTRTERATRLASYHVGRLTTYLTLGGCVALLNSTLTRLIGNASVAQAVGWCVGILMIGMGTMRLVASVTMQNEAVSHSIWTQVWTKQVISMRKHYAGWNIPTAAFSWGLTSTLLPCGWLYFFVLAAAAAPTSAMTIAIMFAFWLGTLPLLSVAAWSWTSMSPRLKALSQPIAAICIIGFGAYTLMGRSNIDLSSMARPVTSSTTASMMTFDLIRKSLQAELPCCIGKNEQESGSIAAKQLSPMGLRDYEEISHARNP